MRSNKRKCVASAQDVKIEPSDSPEESIGGGFNFLDLMSKFGENEDIKKEPEEIKTEVDQPSNLSITRLIKSTVGVSVGASSIEGVQFDVMGDSEIARCAELHVEKRDLYYYLSNKPFPCGVLDLRLGCNRNDTKCETCGRGLMECVGHWGYIHLQLPVFHVGFFKYTIQLLYCICKRCSSLLLPQESIDKLQHTYFKRSDDPLVRPLLFKKILSLCRKTTKCPACGFRQGVIRRIVKPTMDQFMKLRHMVKYKEAGKVVVFEDELNPLQVRRLFEAINPVHARILNIIDPQRLIICNLPVPPACIRPSVSIEGQGTTEDDLTCILSDIVELNNVMNTQITQGFQTNQVIGNWQFLQLQCTRLINADAPAVSQLLAAKNISKPGRGICQRLKGKEGRFRGNLSGKRVDFSARTVISPDPNVGVDEIVVPEYVARRLTYPEKVTLGNIGILKSAVLNGVSKWPGAAYVVKRDGVKCTLRFANPKQIAEGLQIGDVVERHLWNGDVVLFNRQPSLHRMSIMAHRVRVMPGSTFRFNECVCHPYNADFDGDEMNLHLPQTYEARAESLYLMSVLKNFTTPRNGDPLIAATQDFLSASYLLTCKDRFLTRSQICQILSHLGDCCLETHLPPPAIVYPYILWTGKQVYTAMLKQIGAMVNLACSEREFQKPGANVFGRKQPDFMCIKDGHVIFAKSELICGALAKTTLGASKEGLFYQLLARNGAKKAADVMLKISKLTSRWISDFGMTIGLDDTTPDATLLETKRLLLQQGYSEVQMAIANAASIEPFPGCTRAETLELQVKRVLDDLRNQAGRACNSSLSADNKPLIMFNSGAKGALINIAQMVACVGQQNVMGQRIHQGFIGRTLPHFEVGSIDAKSRGFVANSFFSGLDPAEFFFHTMSGREGLIDTAVKTSETGYMQRRLMKALEDLAICYDHSVRTSDGQIVQFIYGDDGLSALGSHSTSGKAIAETLVHIRSLTKPRNSLCNGAWINTFGIIPPQGVSLTGAINAMDWLKLKTSVKLPRKITAKLEALISWKKGNGTSTVDASTMERIKQNVYAHFLVYSQVPPAVAHAPLFPEEINKWVHVVEALCREALPPCIQQQLMGEEITLVNGDDEVTRACIANAKLEAALQNDACICSFSKLIIETLLKWCREHWQSAIDCSSLEILEKQYTSVNMKQPTTHLKFRLKAIAPESRISVVQIYEYVRCCWNDYLRGICEPGEAIGALGAQSIGEPGTQMTLKTFHFAGVASMNVTLGVPRIKEIINAASTIQTPIIEVPLENSHDLDFAMQILAKIQRRTLGQVVLHVKELYSATVALLLLQLDTQYIKEQHLQIDADLVCNLIRDSPIVTKFKLAKNSIAAMDKGLVSIRLVPNQQLMFQLNALISALMQIVVAGGKDVKRCVVKQDVRKSASASDGKAREYALAVEGYGLQKVMGTFGVDATRVISNHVAEVAKVLGIEAARQVIVAEIKKSMDAYGIDIDGRYMKMLGDVMTFRGEVVGINRFGIQKMRASSLMLASFEETNEHLFQAAVHRRRDPIKGVSECVIMGKPIALGTGAFDLLYDSKEMRQHQQLACH